MNKKISAVVLAALLAVLALAANGAKAKNVVEGEVADLFAAGYEVGMNVFDYDQNTLQVLLQDYENQYYMLYTADLDDEQAAAYDAIDIFDENYETDMEEFLAAQDYTLEDLNSLVPAQEEMDAYAGKTIGDIKEEGFESLGYCWSDSSWTMYFENDEIAVTFFLADPNGIEDPDSASEEEINALVISEAQFDGISSNYFY